MKRLVWASLTLITAAASTHLFAACGSESSIETPADGGDDPNAFTDAIVDGQRGDAPDCKPKGQACTTSLDCCGANCAAGPSGNKECLDPVGECNLAGEACASGTECCTLSCIGGACATKQCVADNQACGSNAECCGGSCAPNGTGGGVCKPLSTTCKTAGNPCTDNAQCCGRLCNGGVCSPNISFCTQLGEVCASNTECCGGNCVKQSGAALGLCGETAAAPGATQCAVKGSVCGASTDAVPSCGGTCCSRVCAPTGAAPGFLVCQPPSGCSPTGELCRNDSDCCGWSGAPPPVNGAVSCAKASPTQEFGRCDNGTVCREPGSICKPSTEACSAENNCCEPNGAPNPSWCNQNPDNCCKKDALGIPRCLLNVVDCTSNPPDDGASCATSADCCGKPCVGNKCAGKCVPKEGACTTHADCCSGLPCNIPTGSSAGKCGDATGGGSDGGAGTCALYGQSCTGNADCCNAVPCTNLVCRYP